MNKDIQMTLRLNRKDHEMLKKLSEDNDLSMSAVLRALILREYSRNKEVNRDEKV